MNRGGCKRKRKRKYLEREGRYYYCKKQRTSLKQIEIKIHRNCHDPCYKDTQRHLAHLVPPLKFTDAKKHMELSLQV